MKQNRKLVVGVIAAIFVLSVIVAAAVMTSDTSFFNPNISQTGTVRKIPISGPITSSSSGGLLGSQSLTSEDIAKKIREADNAESVDAILLEINSPGGQPVASHEIVRAVDDVDKPIAAQIREVGASGAYWVASATDHIVADPVSITGSVGVRASYLQFSGLLKDYNVTYEQITKGKYKDLGSQWTELTEDEERVLQDKIDAIGTYFLNDVVANRNLSAAERERVKTGVFFVGVESTDVGLVDELGGEATAVDYLENATNTSSLTVKEARFQRGFLGQLSQASLSLSKALFTSATRRPRAGFQPRLS